jgi:hypothetical protein
MAGALVGGVLVAPGDPGAATGAAGFGEEHAATATPAAHSISTVR